MQLIKHVVLFLASLACYSMVSCFSVATSDDSHEVERQLAHDMGRRENILRALRAKLSLEDDDEESSAEDAAYLNSNRKRAYNQFKDLELCNNVNCDKIYSNGQVSKTWRMAQLTTCCPKFRKTYYTTYKKNAA